MNTRTIVLYEVAGLAGLITAVVAAWGNILYVLAVFAIYVSFRVRYLRVKFDQVIAKTAIQARSKMWSDISDVCHLEQETGEQGSGELGAGQDSGELK